MPPSISISSRRRTTAGTAIHRWSSPKRKTGSGSSAAGRNTGSNANDGHAMLSRSPTAYDDKIYSADWRAFVDPEMPETIAPTAILLDRHLGTPIEHKAAVIVDGEPASYGALAKRVEDVSAGLAGIGVVPENRILLFGTDSLDYITMWLGAVRIGAVPAAVSDLYKARDLLYFIRDTAA